MIEKPGSRIIGREQCHCLHVNKTRRLRKMTHTHFSIFSEIMGAYNALQFVSWPISGPKKALRIIHSGALWTGNYSNFIYSFEIVVLVKCISWNKFSSIIMFNQIYTNLAVSYINYRYRIEGAWCRCISKCIAIKL